MFIFVLSKYFFLIEKKMVLKNLWSFSRYWSPKLSQNKLNKIKMDKIFIQRTKENDNMVNIEFMLNGKKKNVIILFM